MFDESSQGRMCLMKLKLAAFTLMYGMSLKKFTHLEGCGIKGMWLIFKTKMCLLKANIDVKTLEKCLKGQFLE